MRPELCRQSHTIIEVRSLNLSRNLRTQRHADLVVSDRVRPQSHPCGSTRQARPGQLQERRLQQRHRLQQHQRLSSRVLAEP